MAVGSGIEVGVSVGTVIVLGVAELVTPGAGIEVGVDGTVVGVIMAVGVAN